MTVRLTRLAPALLCVIAATACGRSEPEPGMIVVQPGAPGEASQDVVADRPTPIAHTEADVAFMQGMIGHHRQALDMTALIADRTTREDFRLLGQRITVSQTDEIAMMEEWLRARGAEVPGPHAMHEAGAVLMPGMLSAAEMEALAAATGTEFERLFLEGMIKHHGGALTMVKDLFAQPGAGQQSEIFAFASDVEADQSMEIDRMRGVLAGLR